MSSMTVSFQDHVRSVKGSRFEESMRMATRAAAVLVGFSMPLSTSFAEISTGLFVACWVLSGGWRTKWQTIQSNPVVRVSLALFGVLLLGTTWSTASWGAAVRCLLKYRELLYLPMLLVVFQEARVRALGKRAFQVSMAIVLCLSYLEWLSGWDVGMKSDANDYIIGKDRIIHSLLMAFAVFLAAHDIADGSRWRWLYAAFLALAVPNVLFLVQGRTGYVLLAVLTTLFLWQKFRLRGVIYAAGLIGVMAGGAYTASAAVRGRVEQTLSQLRNQFGPEKKHSVDARLEFYEHTLGLIARHPIRGTGTGSFIPEYKRLGAELGLETPGDPHNEYLHLAVQAGWGGTALFLMLLGIQWHRSGRLPAAENHIGRGVVLAIAIGGMFNTLILSVTGGLLWSYFSAMALGATLNDPSAESASEKPSSMTAEDAIVRRAA